MAENIDLHFLKELEREKVLEVLYRDKVLRAAEEQRIRKLKSELKKIHWKGAKSFNQQYTNKTCARCQKSLGKILNSGAVCKGCSHRICTSCRIIISARVWKCTVCYAYGEVKIKSGDWFFEERANKFPSCEGKQESVGETLLKSYQGLRLMAASDYKQVVNPPKSSNIAIVPPTPPPFIENVSVSNTGELKHTKGFTKSVENLFISLTTHMKKISKSHNDVTVNQTLLTTDYGQGTNNERRSQSDTAINKQAMLTKAPSLPILFKKATANEDEDRVDIGRVAKANSADTVYTGAAKMDSTCSISSTCTEDGNFENARVTGEIEFCIVYNYKTSCLEICIKACKNLAYGDEKKKKCSPYIKTYLLPDKSPQSKLKTTIKKNTTHPTFSETLRYNIDRSQLETRSLQVSVWHSETLKRKVFLGEVIIPLDSWKFEEDSTQSYNWYQLNSKPDQYEDCVPVQYNGELCIKVKFVLPSLSSKIQTQQLSMEDLQNKMTILGQLKVVIIGAKNLPSLRPDGTLNSFVKVCLILPDNRQLKQKTPVLKKKACPQWNHQLVFSDVLLCELLDSCLDITVWDHAAFGVTDRFLGGVRLERGILSTDSRDMVEVASGQSWQNILRRPNTWNDTTLTLHPNMEYMMKT
ncbi:synaptotagmin-like protein 3 isoform X1 [Acipenser ruthenus]|uniref:synaptotagmin-like protein 3 isoform X1 n=1 Tax=Acipenser ruthenus TaxID=7906 RepID=UPI00145B5F10|nr:synaptotagmin-like protein 3 isoform X1 [Acipenser ruthenus]